jgi:glyoxylase-like metal-dependent hydrolase (beta-lactamase superfamily II)
MLCNSYDCYRLQLYVPIFDYLFKKNKMKKIINCRISAANILIASAQKRFTIFFLISFLGFNTFSSAQSKLQLKTITSSATGFSVNSVLITGEKDAVLIDAQFTLSDAHLVVASILESGKNLTTIYITHPHPDHYFGIDVIRQAFPKTKIVASQATVDEIEKNWQASLTQWKPAYGNNLPAGVTIPEVLEGNSIRLEGNTLQIFTGIRGDDAFNSYLWIPSIKAVITGDIVYNGVYPWTLETTAVQRKDWIAAIDKIAALNPVTIIGGHKNPVLKDDISGLVFTKKYLAYYDSVLPSAKSSEEFQSKIKAKFPGLMLDIILKLAADAAFSKK